MPIRTIYNTVSSAADIVGGAATAGLESLANAVYPTYTDNDLAQSRYDFSYKVFPNDIGMDDNGHYMIININVPTFGIASRIYGGTPGAPATSLRNSDGSYFFTLGRENEVSKVDKLRYGTSPGSGQQAPLLSIPRGSRRIVESVALYMPTPLVYNTQHAYEEISLTALAGKVGVGLISAGAAGIAAWNAFRNAARRSGTSFLSSAGQVIGQSVSTLAQLTGNPINPAVEILFATTPVRQFTFEVLMAPRNERESIAMKEIITTLRFHSSPELNQLTRGLTWIPPADFDITFFNKGVENFNIIRINTCVLERIEVDYAPTGTYSTFRNGHPVAARLSLGFREVEPIHKQRVLQGF
jgi:hypothetical protein